MNTRFNIFMRSVDDDILEEAQLYIPRKPGLLRTAGLAACLCVIMGAYFMTMGGFNVKSESPEALPDNLYAESSTMAASATAAQGEVSPETNTADNGKQETALSAPTEADAKRSMLPANAVICNFSVSENKKQIDFSVGDMDFSLTSSENIALADEKMRNILLSDREDETITWYSDEGDTKYTLELLEGDYSLLYSTAEEIAENLGIEIFD